MCTMSPTMRSSSDEIEKTAFDAIVVVLMLLFVVALDRYFAALPNASLLIFLLVVVGEEDEGVGVGALVLLKSNTSFLTGEVMAEVWFKNPNTPPVAGLGVMEEGLGGIGEGVSEEMEKLLENLPRRREEVEGGACCCEGRRSSIP